ncbi:MAG: carboxymuconolactone decarboxylase family protein [Acidimicrobiaceae bacterium]|nr:carboxymuconolactone decarboxylase family protein [Acidimicrobiaceae bacterium]
MADKYHKIAEELRGPARDLRSEIPEVIKGYAELHAAATAEGVLSKKTKELIALAISVVTRCDGCISSHAKALAMQGAERDEVAEAIGVAIMLSGGPGTVYGPRAFEAFLEYQEAR